jgi:hypothetical protein
MKKPGPTEQELSKLRRANRLLRKSLYDVTHDLEKTLSTPEWSPDKEHFLQELILKLKARLAEVDKQMKEAVQPRRS